MFLLKMSFTVFCLSVTTLTILRASKQIGTPDLGRPEGVLGDHEPP